MLKINKNYLYQRKLDRVNSFYKFRKICANFKYD